MKSSGWFLLLLLVCPGILCAQTRFESSPYQTSLVELYTSEGCSSCPPADAWLSSLKSKRDLWQKFVPVAFHVDYWNGLGWKDRFADRRFSQRQRAYSRAWFQRTVYTPGMVLNGEEWRSWSGNRSVPVVPGSKPGVLSLEGGQAVWRARFEPLRAEPGDWIAYGVLLGLGVESNIRAGENRGRVFTHDFLVLDFVETPMTAEGRTWVAAIEMKTGALSLSPGLAIAVWVSEKGSLKPVQATGGLIRE